MHPNTLKFDPKKNILGRLCKKGHDFQGTGKSLMYRSHICVLCQVEHNEIKRAAYRKTPEYKAVLERRAYRASPEYAEIKKEKRRRIWARPENVKKRREAAKDPVFREKIRAATKKYNAKPESIAKRKAYYANPETRAKRREKEKIRKATPEYKAKSRVRCARIQATPEGKKKHKDRQAKYRATSKVKKRIQNEIDSLDDSYIKNAIFCKFGIRGKDVPQEMINLKREQLTITRLLRKIKKGDENGVTGIGN